MSQKQVKLIKIREKKNSLHALNRTLFFLFI